jgi:tyrosyl-tRNA synthetase
MAAGIKPTIFLADYHAWINGKLGGDLELIQKIGKGYFKQCFETLGLEEGKVDYVLGSELYEKMGGEYWADVMKIMNSTTKERMVRCTTIMGRKETDAALPASVMLYPAMQVADVWALDVDIMHAGMDQRKVHVLAREMAEKLKKPKAVAVHGALLSGLHGGGRRMEATVRSGGVVVKATSSDMKSFVERNAQHDIELRRLSEDEAMIENKMSKSNPNSCIFVHDSEEEIRAKMKKAHCPPGEIAGNPVIEMAQAFVLRDRPLEIKREEKFGGDIIFESAAELNSAFINGKVHPMDLKAAVGDELVEMLAPCRKYFEKRQEMVEEVRRARG